MDSTNQFQGDHRSQDVVVTLRSDRAATILCVLRRFVSTIRAYAPAIFIIGFGVFGIYSLYTMRFATVEMQSRTIWDMFPPTWRRISMLIISLIAFALLLLMITHEWNWETRHITNSINENAAIGFVEAFATWFLIMILASGLDMVLQPYAKVEPLELGWLVASCVVLYDVTASWQMIQDMIKHMLFTLLFLVTIVNLFVTVPLTAPFRELAIVATVATVIDFIASCGVRNRRRIVSFIARVLQGKSRSIS